MQPVPRLTAGRFADQPYALVEAYRLHDGRVVCSKGNDHITDAVCSFE